MKEVIKMTFEDYVKTVLGRGLTDTQKAKRLGISRQMYSYYKNGYVPKTEYPIGRIARKLDRPFMEVYSVIKLGQYERSN